ncbi:PLD nuclease N-terminal domain-containing protein, partial [Monoglobus pectinilyticus]
MTRFFKIIYSNKLFCLLMMIAQLSVLLLLSAWLGDYSKYFYTFMNFLSAVLIIYEINREEEPGFKLTWVMLIAIIPIFGTLLYIFLHYNRASKKIAVHSDEIRGRTLKYTKQETDVLQKFSETYQEDIGISKYIYDYSGFPVYKNSSAEYFSLGDQMFIDLKDEL